MCGVPLLEHRLHCYLRRGSSSLQRFQNEMLCFSQQVQVSLSKEPDSCTGRRSATNSEIAHGRIVKILAEILQRRDVAERTGSADTTSGRGRRLGWNRSSVS